MTQIDELDKNDYSELLKRHKIRSLQLRNTPISWRIAKLKAIKSWLMAHFQELEQAAALDLGKPAEEVCVTEIYPVLTEVRHAIKKLPDWSAPKPVGGSLTFLGTRAHLYTEPKGTSLIISPWNYPLLLALGPVISAVAAGNTIVLKPSEFTPAMNKVIGKLLSDCFEEDEATMIEGEAQVATELLRLPFDHIFFTGSPQVGKVVMTAAAKNLSSITLELGGKSPTIVDETANIRDATKRIAWGKWTNAGQTCVAPDYVYVHESVSEKFIDALRGQAQTMYSASENYASIINDRHFSRLRSLLTDAEAKGAKILMSGRQEGRLMGPVILDNLHEDMRIMQEEIFGPILPIIRYSHLDEVIDYINSHPKPLALYHYSTSKRNQHRVLSETSSGAVVFNDNVLQFGHPQLAMGGVNHSGIGKAHGEAGFLAFSHQKSVLKQRSGFTIASIVYPPYAKWKKTVIELMLKYF